MIFTDFQTKGTFTGGGAKPFTGGEGNIRAAGGGGGLWPPQYFSTIVNMLKKHNTTDMKLTIKKNRLYFINTKV